ncbi:hypothetical protein CIHG_07035 [Coccidioides immitis H538.4]|uniref:Uncharacterized protein n=1 Tax=Coccidioides immitis H538.4 TaxID=396776 RepID=A0A0J8UNG9_COCIT|nr:hypothetical protein CIHG_07035 [Coccidioides immitis H538.4]
MRLVEQSNFSNGSSTTNTQHHQRRATHPFMKSHRSKPRRWPLVLRFIKGAVHSAVLVPLICHALFTVLVVCLDKYVYDSLGLPPTIVRSINDLPFLSNSSSSTNQHPILTQKPLVLLAL